MEEANEYIVIDPNGSGGEAIELHGLLVVLPKKPPRSKILFHDRPKHLQLWKRIPMPEEMQRVRSMDEWHEKPSEFRKKFSTYIEQEFQRRRDGVWFYNNGVPTYITGRHYMFLQWSKIDVGYPQFLQFQREIFIHMAGVRSLIDDCIGQLYTKCRRSGYTNVCSPLYLLTKASQVKDKLLGIQSKTGKDAQENIFMKKVVLDF